MLRPELVLSLQVPNSFNSRKGKSILKALLDAGYIILSIIKLVYNLEIKDERYHKR